MKKRPTPRQIKIHDAVCSRGFSIADTASNYGISKSTVRRYMDTVTEFGPLDGGSASMSVDLSGGVITVKHGTEGVILLQGASKEGSWERIWDVMENELGITRINS